MPQRQAEAHAEAFAEVIDDKLATKQDLKDLEVRLTHTLMTRLGGMMVIGFTLCTAILGLLIAVHH